MNELTVQLQPRQAALTIQDFGKLERLIETTFEAKPIYEPCSIPQKDADGNIYAWEAGVIETGLEVTIHGEPNKKLLEAIRRPATAGHIVAHITRLAAHLRHTKGKSAFQIIAEDIGNDLNGVSEWAVMKACEQFRQTGKPFFPDTPELITTIRKWDDFSRKAAGLDKRPEKKKEAPRGEGWQKASEAQKDYVRKLLEENGIKPHKEKQNGEN